MLSRVSSRAYRYVDAQVDSGIYTWRDFIELDEDDQRELVDGRLVEMEVPTKTHEGIVAALITLLTMWAWDKKAGVVLGSGYKLRIHDRRGAMPDVQFFRRGNVPKGQEKGLEEGRPDLVVEVISPTSRSKDRVRKLGDYAAIGVPEYWLIDSESRVLERLVLRDGLYCIAEALEGDVLFQPSGWDGLEIPLERLWGSVEGEDETSAPKPDAP